MTETKPLPPLEIVGERFTIRHFAGTETLEVAKDVDGDLAFHAEHDGTVAMIAAADVSRFIDALARLTGNGPILLQVAEMIQRARREALEDARRVAKRAAFRHARTLRDLPANSEERSAHDDCRRCADEIAAAIVALADEQHSPIRAARLAALREAAEEVDCGCSARDAVLAAKTTSDRWRACGEACCGALMARDILSLAEKE